MYNLKPRISANTTFATENLKFAPEDCFSAQICLIYTEGFNYAFCCRVKVSLIMPILFFFVASVSCLRVGNCKKKIKTIWQGQGTYLLSRATYIAKCCWRVAKIINFILNFSHCLPMENMESKLGE